MQILEFKSQEIKLKDLLKVLNLTPSGGIAKAIIQEEGLILNGQVCFVAGKKCYPGDEIIFDDVKILVI